MIIKGRLLLVVCWGTEVWCLNWSKTNFSLQIAHSVKQKSYILWKYKVLKDWIISKPRYYKRNNSLTIKTISHSALTELAELFYPSGKKVLPGNLEHLVKDPITLAVWFVDDGNVIRRNDKAYGYHLNTQSFSREENILISQALSKIYSVESMLEKNHGKYRIRIMKKSSRNKFNEAIRKYMRPEMLYKIS